MSKILIIDDDPDIVKLLRFKLSQEGYKVIAAVDAYNGIQSARREKPDLIILDIMLPAGGGIPYPEEYQIDTARLTNSDRGPNRHAR